ncbi:hypothetical protein ABZ470_26285 [Streptosporangium sp. NPDC020072]|uniref:hypothetical protein n=1 Tax=Streptosporangium sp. NPDC020072 TaxID=3154788 RepID=UPI00341BE79F
MEDLVVEPGRIIAVLRRRIEDLTYENAVLSAAVDQQRDEINELLREASGAGDHPR